MLAEKPSATNSAPMISTVEGMWASPVVPGKVYADARSADSDSDAWTPHILDTGVVCYPLNLPPGVSTVFCNPREFCLPLSPNGDDQVKFYPNNQPDARHGVLDFRSPTATTTSRQQVKRWPLGQHDESPNDISMLTMPFAPASAPSQFTVTQVVTSASPQDSPIPIAAAPPPPPPTTNAALESHVYPNSPVSPTIAGPCQIPKTYRTICHPAVIPCIVIIAYLVATYIFYVGENPFSPQPPQPQPQKPLPPGFQALHNYFQPRGPDGAFDPLALGDMNAEPPLGNLAPPPRAWAQQPACFFLTTIFTYGAGLIILGSFLGGLCNCVRTECAFT
ncbi:hypothetical protein TWF696_001148 [Orbilia brochopaga]|uniref:Uncharacterized protein n=1 Tax=Orbilia brochopaga TaxID=3140254 RepID=A0AAV9VEQ5_9PEZI